ncbi:threonine aspartase 1-like protein [Cladochytrium replicatum]|nr:threonine aspartase 1-like protein [Cladochytrium replicatum]
MRQSRESVYPMPAPYVVVHAGAGFHSTDRERERAYKNVVANACKRAMEVLLADSHAAVQSRAVIAAREAVRYMEDSPITNAGRGSNLTLEGSVECDAAVMTDCGDFGAVGAVEGVNNPIDGACEVMNYGANRELSVGRIAPLLLVGNGAAKFCHDRGVNMLPEGSSHITEEALERWNRYRSWIETDQSNNSRKRMRSPSKERDSHLMDTVGAIVVDAEGNMAAAVSSGGIAMKHSGRVGEAACYGSGVWAQTDQRDSDQWSRVGCSVSGTGEQIMRTLFARDLSRLVLDSSKEDQAQKPSAIRRFFRTQFLNSKELKNYSDRLAGCILVTHTHIADTSSPQSLGEVWYAHTTPSMCIAYFSATQNRPKAVMSRLDPQDRDGIRICGVPL